ncbi:MAG: ATPase P [Geobacter sp.]|nr:MAG: ATPase P [Geobacter sp.]
MVCFDIPHKEKILIEHVVLDFNGTIAIDGTLIPGVVERLEELHSLVTIHVITADTNDTARSQLENVPCTLKIIGEEGQDQAKFDYARRLGLRNVLAIGNGRNDYLLLKGAALGICVIQGEGAAGKTMQAADMICVDINDALALLLRPRRVTATLRN